MPASGRCPADASTRARRRSKRRCARLDEEIGLRLADDAVVGWLDDYPTRSGYVISPVVLWGGADPELRPSPDEVLALYRIGLHALRDGEPRFVSIPESDAPRRAGTARQRPHPRADGRSPPPVPAGRTRRPHRRTGRPSGATRVRVEVSDGSTRNPLPADVRELPVERGLVAASEARTRPPAQRPPRVDRPRQTVRDDRPPDRADARRAPERRGLHDDGAPGEPNGWDQGSMTIHPRRCSSAASFGVETALRVRSGAATARRRVGAVGAATVA